MVEKRVRFYTLAPILVLVCLVGFGCRNKAVERPKQEATRQVTDDLGRTITLPLKVTRAISLAPSITESVFAIGAGGRLVGVTTYCNYPEQAKAIQKVGDSLSPNLETIVALKPDVVLISTASQIEAFKNTLEQNGIAVYVTNPTSLDGVMKNLKQLGELFGTQQSADKIVADLQRRVEAVHSATDDDVKPHAKVFVQISKEPLFTIGKQSFLTGLIATAGGHSVTADVDTAYPKLSKETASALNPDVIILSDSEDNKEPNEVFKNSPAVKNRRVYRVNADILSRPGPRLVDALEQISKTLALTAAH